MYIERQELVGLILLIVVTLVVLAGVVIIPEMAGKEEYAKEYTPDLPEGTLVTISGTADNPHETKNGGHLIMNIDDVMIFIPATALPEFEITEGLPVKIIGKIQIWNQNREIMVSHRDDITIDNTG